MLGASGGKANSWFLSAWELDLWELIEVIEITADLNKNPNESDNWLDSL